MISEARLIKSELILRDLALPEEVLLTRKSLIRWLALSLGLISPNESRRLILDVLDVLISYHIKKTPPTTKDILLKLEDTLKNAKPPHLKAVYYHLLRLREVGVITRRKGRYYFGEGEGDGKLFDIFSSMYTKRANKVFINVKMVLDKIEVAH